MLGTTTSEANAVERTAAAGFNTNEKKNKTAIIIILITMFAGDETNVQVFVRHFFGPLLL